MNKLFLLNIIFLFSCSVTVDYTGTSLTCDEDGRCPEGFFCDQNHECRPDSSKNTNPVDFCCEVAIQLCEKFFFCLEDAEEIFTSPDVCNGFFTFMCIENFGCPDATLFPQDVEKCFDFISKASCNDLQNISQNCLPPKCEELCDNEHPCKEGYTCSFSRERCGLPCGESIECPPPLICFDNECVQCVSPGECEGKQCKDGVCFLQLP